jgi:predicted permease
MSIDGKALAFVLAVALLSSLLFGLLPALRASRTSLSLTLSEASSGTGRKLGLQAAMVGVEMCLAIVLLIGTTLMIQTLLNLQNVDPGFSKEGILTMRMFLPPNRYEDNASIARFQRDLTARAESAPGVVAASTVDLLPPNHETSGLEFTIEGREIPEEPWRVIRFTVGPRYFDVMGIRHIKGRLFDERDHRNAPRVAVVDRTMAERFWPDCDPIGAILNVGSDQLPVTVIGIVGYSKQVDLKDEKRPYIYLFQEQFPGRYMRLLAKKEGEPTSYAGTLPAAVKEVDPLLPVSEVRSMGNIVEEFLLPQQLMVDTLAIIALGAIMLAMMGTYGLMSFFVSQQNRNIGIRVALGATRGDVRLLILKRVMKLAGIGIGAGLVGSFGLMRLMSSMLFGVTAANPAAFVSAAVFLASVAVASGLIGARRATSMDPLLAIRYE